MTTAAEASSSPIKFSTPNVGCSQTHLYFPITLSNLDTKIENVIAITNHSASEPVIWKMRRSSSNPLLVTPTSGTLHPKESVRVVISCTAADLRNLLSSSTSSVSAAGGGMNSASSGALNNNISSSSSGALTAGGGEKMQIIARFFHPTDNPGNLADCWANKVATAEMPRFKFDLPLVFTDSPPKQIMRHQRPSMSSGGAAARRSTTPGRRASSSGAGGASSPGATSTTAVSSSPVRGGDSSSNAPSPAPRSSAGTQQQQQEQQQQNNNNNVKVRSSSPLLATSSNTSKPLFTPANSQSTFSAVGSESSFNSLQQQLEEFDNNKKNDEESSSSAMVQQQQKKSGLQKIVLFSIPIYIFFPMLVLAFAIGVRYGELGTTTAAAVTSGKQ